MVPRNQQIIDGNSNCIAYEPESDVQPEKQKKVEAR